jgi:TetR/AcrR family transcriptional repressor of nem operon
LRLTKDKATSNRKQIVEAAATLFRARGLDKVSLTDVMQEAGFTHGGFYNHFSSKEELAAEAIACAFKEFTENLAMMLGAADAPDDAFASAIAGYLAPAHRDASGGGCPTAALLVDAARGGEKVQAAFADGIEAYLDLFAEHLGGDTAEARPHAMVMLSGMIGALAISRAVKDARPALSSEILDNMANAFSDLYSTDGHRGNGPGGR